MQKMNTHGMNTHGTNTMDSLKSSMTTLFMFDSFKSSHSPGNNWLNMLYMFLAAQLVEFIYTHANTGINWMMQQLQKKQQQVVNSLNLDTHSQQTKTGSITVSIPISDMESLVGQALLDYVTNHPNTRHISFKRQTFLLNQKETIELDDGVYARMTESLQEQEEGGNNKTTAWVQVIELFSYKHNAEQLRAFLERLRHNYAASVKNKMGKTRCYFHLHPTVAPINMDGKKDLSRLPNYFTFDMKPFHTNRTFKNLFGKDIELIRQRVQHFVHHRSWYDEKGIPYTLGLLLSGPPGTGKTSTIKCLANETNRHILSINLNTDMTKLQLENLFYNENIVVVSEGQSQTVCIPLDQRIYVLEDVDAQDDMVLSVGSRTITHSENTSTTCIGNPSTEHLSQRLRVDLSFLLNLLDGILENPGRIVIMTSNCPEKLDSALVRPGRIDIIATFGYCCPHTIQQMMEFFYDQPLDPVQIQTLQEVTRNTLTPAEVSRICFEHFNNPHAALQQLCLTKPLCKTKPLCQTNTLCQTKQKQTQPVMEENTTHEEKQYFDFLQDLQPSDIQSSHPMYSTWS